MSTVEVGISEGSTKSRSLIGSVGTVESTGVEELKIRDMISTLRYGSVANRPGNPSCDLIRKSSPKRCHEAMNQVG